MKCRDCPAEGKQYPLTSHSRPYKFIMDPSKSYVLSGSGFCYLYVNFCALSAVSRSFLSFSLHYSSCLFPHPEVSGHTVLFSVPAKGTIHIKPCLEDTATPHCLDTPPHTASLSFKKPSWTHNIKQFSIVHRIS